MRTLVVIPARYASTRFPGKPLALLCGKPVLQWVWEGVSRIGGDVSAMIATDDERIRDVASLSFGASVMMTSPRCQSGTDRCGEVVRTLAAQEGERFDLVVNVQGDEPFVDPVQLQALVDAFADPSVRIATLATPIRSTGELLSPDCVKVVEACGKALYFSRQPLPYRRDVPVEEWIERGRYLKHVGIYAYRSAVLEELCRLEPSELEKSEKLEQLRWLEADHTIHVLHTDHANIGIDTPADLEAAERMQRDKERITQK